MIKSPQIASKNALQDFFWQKIYTQCFTLPYKSGHANQQGAGPEDTSHQLHLQHNHDHVL